MLLLVGGSSLRGDPVAGGPLALAQADEIALSHNADLRVARAQAEAALAQLRAVREFPNPVASYSVAKINTDGQTNATAAGNTYWNRSYDSIFSLSQLVELGKRGVRRTSAEAGVRSAEALQQDSRRLLLQAVGQLYVAAVEARQETQVLADSAASLRREADIAASRLHAGDIAASDQAQIEIAADQLDLSAASARANARLAVVALETLLGLPEPRGATVLADTLISAVPPSLTAEAATGTRPDIAAAEAGLAKSEADLALQRRGMIPDMTVSLQYERQPPDQPNTVGIGLSFPLPLWNRNTGNTLAARAARDQAEAQLDKVRTQASADVASARVAYAEAQQRATVYRHNLQPKSAAITQAVAYAYDKGGAALVELLGAERNDNDIRLAAARAEADAASTAFALAAALNRLEPPTAPDQR
jgi:cobalt-zinc-cadmium efflux system outer membrane protein